MAGLMKKIFDMINPAEEEYDDSQQFDELASEKLSNNEDNGKVFSISKGKLMISCFKPSAYNSEIPDIANSIISGDVAVLDLELENKDPEISRRIIDFLRGTVHAIKGKFVKVAKNTYVLTPSTINISGAEVVNELEKNDIYI